ncbi:hypothetical protein CR513_09745, partial [Mucuna pruriens]
MKALSDNLLSHILHNKMASLQGRIAQAETVYTVVYILSRCPTKAIQDNTPIKACSGQKSSSKHLRVFGSIRYIHRHKLEDKIVRGIFLGYSTQSKGYQVYNLQTKKLSITIEMLMLMKMLLGIGKKKRL